MGLKLIVWQRYNKKTKINPSSKKMFFTRLVRRANYAFRIINTGFDASDYFEYTGELSPNNSVVASRKRQVFSE